ncbi:hypothetical protein RIF29_18233 [Crotalaria pallida]|uniref:Legume lectin domain-containing protein n=1 Tax=Crotalaria pallida TaxID=3830 RepID=A0AAN9FSB2_CROPI
MLLNNAHSSDTTSFTYAGFSQHQDKLIFQGDARINSIYDLELTPDPATKNSVGRVLYEDEIQLWEKSTHGISISDFETTITFNLTSSPNDNNPADGFAFFIAPPDSTIPKDSYGGYLGLFSKSTALDPTKNHVVAVEFDTYFSGNSWDPNYRHIGIDVNTIESSITTPWERQDKKQGEVRINYNSATKFLTVESDYPGGKPYAVALNVDLTTRLPEKVRVGLSAATGDNVQVHTIHAWNFKSKLIKNEGISFFTWEEELLHSFLQQLPNLSLDVTVRDSWVWASDRNGLFSVKGAYSVISSLLHMDGLDGSEIYDELYHIVDVKAILPEKVRVGLSTST